MPFSANIPRSAVRFRSGVDLKPVSSLVGTILLLVAAAQLLPLGHALLFPQPRSAVAFVVSIALCAILGLAGRAFGDSERPIHRREATLVVGLAWISASILGAIPYVLSGTLPDLASALFESASGFTTTGASVMSDIEASSESILLWRSLTQWMGGAGIVVLFVALLPAVGPGAKFLYKLESPGPGYDPLRGRVRNEALTVWRIYIGLTVALALLLVAEGLSVFDAVCHAFTTLSTGGFSTRNESVAAFGSSMVEWTITAFMFVAAINFSLLFRARRAPWRVVWDVEFRVFASIVFAAVSVIFLDLHLSSDQVPWFEDLRHAAFQSIALMTGTGYATANYDAWNDQARTTLIMIMLIGGCAGSTTGGIKVARIVIATKTALREIVLNFSPRRVLHVRVGRGTLGNREVIAVAGFVLLFLLLWASSTLILSFSGHDLETSFSATLACLGNIGPGLADVGPTQNYGFFSSWQKLLLTVLMWLGRLEIVALAALALPTFWRN